VQALRRTTADPACRSSAESSVDRVLVALHSDGLGSINFIQTHRAVLLPHAHSHTGTSSRHLAFSPCPLRLHDPCGEGRSACVLTSPAACYRCPPVLVGCGGWTHVCRHHFRRKAEAQGHAEPHRATARDGVRGPGSDWVQRDGVLNSANAEGVLNQGHLSIRLPCWIHGTRTCAQLHSQMGRTLVPPSAASGRETGPVRVDVSTPSAPPNS
jgi:hypothetical protein